MSNTNQNTKAAYSGTVTEWCPHCESEIEMSWDLKARGYKAYCPVCGEQLMLCDACKHGPDDAFHDDCDYNSCTHTCKHNKEPDKDFAFLLQFVEESLMDEEICRDQLRALWTAYCIKKDFSPDTLPYDLACRDLWDKVSGSEADTGDWCDFDSFDSFMCDMMV